MFKFKASFKYIGYGLLKRLFNFFIQPNVLSFFQELFIIVLSYTWASPFFINYIHGIQKWLCNRWCHRYVVDQAHLTQSKINLTLKSLNKINRWKVLPLGFTNRRKHHRRDCCATLIYLYIPCIFHHSKCLDIQQKLDMHPLINNCAKIKSNFCL